MGQLVTSNPKSVNTEAVTFRHVVTAQRNGIYRGLNIANSIVGMILSKVEFKPHGEKVEIYLTDTLAVIMIKAPASEKIRLLQDIHKLITAKID